MNLSTEGLQELIMTILTAIVNFDLKQIDLDYLGDLLTEFSWLWNPIWQAINEWLGENIGL